MLPECEYAAPTCFVRVENQYLLDIHGPGRYHACGGTGSNGLCGVCVIRDEDWGVIHRNPAGLCKNS